MTAIFIRGYHALRVQIKGQAARLFKQSAVRLYPFWIA
jgi:hypothetical protein